MPLIAVRNVHKSYGAPAGLVRVLRGVSLTVEQRALCAIVGPSGSGKSTFLAIVGGLDAPSAGEVYVGGHALHRMSPGERARFRAAHIGFVFQSNNLIPVLTAAENVALPLSLRRLTARERSLRVERLLDEVGLRKEAGRRPAELSGGQQQRVGIARALVTGPALVLADEPTAHLDSQTGLEVMALLRTINATRGTAFVFSTHDPAIESIADARIVLRDGIVVPAVRTTEMNGPCRPASTSACATFSGIHVGR
jgi:putative ABC transport system ATP-binding protein